MNLTPNGLKDFLALHGKESNPRPTGYEPVELPSALPCNIGLYQISKD